MKEKNRYIVYKLSKEHDELSGLSYNELKELMKAKPDLYPGLLPSLDCYQPIYAVRVQEEDTVYKIMNRLLQFPPKDFPGKTRSEPVIQVSDMIVMIVDDFATAWYIDQINGNSGNGVLIPNFSPVPGTEKQISLDGEKYTIEGKGGEWTPVHEIPVNGIPFYEMEKSGEPKAMHILLSFNKQIIAENFEKIVPRNDLNWMYSRINSFLGKWLQHFLTGSYITLKPEDLEDPQEEGKCGEDDGRKYSLDEFVSMARDEKNEAVKKQHAENVKNRQEEQIAAKLAEQRAAGDTGDPDRYSSPGPASEQPPFRPGSRVPEADNAEYVQLKDQLALIMQQVMSMSRQVDTISRALSERKIIGE